MSTVWRIWTRFARWRQDRFGDPQEGWTVPAISAEIERTQAKQQTGRHRRRSP